MSADIEQENITDLDLLKEVDALKDCCHQCSSDLTTTTPTNCIKRGSLGDPVRTRGGHLQPRGASIPAEYYPLSRPVHWGETGPILGRIGPYYHPQLPSELGHGCWLMLMPRNESALVSSVSS